MISAKGRSSSIIFLQAFDMAFETTNFPTVQDATISGFRAWVIIFGQCVNIKTAPINR
jgi:hypothetical protein